MVNLDANNSDDDDISTVTTTTMTTTIRTTDREITKLHLLKRFIWKYSMLNPYYCHANVGAFTNECMSELQHLGNATIVRMLALSLVGEYQIDDTDETTVVEIPRERGRRLVIDLIERMNAKTATMIHATRSFTEFVELFIRTVSSDPVTMTLSRTDGDERLCLFEIPGQMLDFTIHSDMLTPFETMLLCRLMQTMHPGLHAPTNKPAWDKVYKSDVLLHQTSYRSFCHSDVFQSTDEIGKIFRATLADLFIKEIYNGILQMYSDPHKEQELRINLYMLTSKLGTMVHLDEGNLSRMSVQRTQLCESELVRRHQKLSTSNHELRRIAQTLVPETAIEYDMRDETLLLADQNRTDSPKRHLGATDNSDGSTYSDKINKRTKIDTDIDIAASRHQIIPSVAKFPVNKTQQTLIKTGSARTKAIVQSSKSVGSLSERLEADEKKQIEIRQVLRAMQSTDEDGVGTEKTSYVVSEYAEPSVEDRRRFNTTRDIVHTPIRNAINSISTTTGMNLRTVFNRTINSPSVIDLSLDVLAQRIAVYTDPCRQRVSRDTWVTSKMMSALTTSLAVELVDPSTFTPADPRQWFVPLGAKPSDSVDVVGKLLSDESLVPVRLPAKTPIAQAAMALFLGRNFYF